MECVHHLAKHVNECEVRREKYTLPALIQPKRSAQESYTYPALRDPPFFTEPVESTWAFMSEHEAEAMLKKTDFGAVKATIDKKLSHGYPKALPRMIAADLLYSGFKFAKGSGYNTAQTSALLSMLYITLRFFNSCNRTTAEDVYYFFKELLCFHSLDFVPTHRLVFNPDEAHLVLSYFCKLFLRHLPIIRLLGLPNFEFAINTYIAPFPVFKKKKGKKGKKEKQKDKKGKKDKKAKKRGKK